MSRRTKLLITTIFLVLLAIPVVYIVLTWSPPNPLRFSVVDFHGPPQADVLRMGTPAVSVNLAVENTSSSPVHLYTAVISKPGSRPDSRDLKDASIWLWNGKAPVIRPGGTLYCSMAVREGRYEDVTRGNLEIHYDWISDIRSKMGDACRWLGERAPWKLQSFIFRHAACDNDVIPLERRMRP